MRRSTKFQGHSVSILSILLFFHVSVNYRYRIRYIIDIESICIRYRDIDIDRDNIFDTNFVELFVKREQLCLTLCEA